MGGASSTAGAPAGIDCRAVRSFVRAATPVEGVRTVDLAGRSRRSAAAGGARGQAAEARRGRGRSCAAADVEEASSFRSSPGSKPRACASAFRARAIVRAMPNLPVAIRRGVVALYSEDADEALKQQLGDLFVALGLCDVDGRRSEVRRDRLGRRRRPGLCRAVYRRADQGGREARAEPTRSPRPSRSKPCSAPPGWRRRRARPWTRSPGASPAPRAPPGGPCGARPRQALDQLVALTIEAAASRGAELAAEARRPVACRGRDAALGARVHGNGSSSSAISTTATAGSGSTASWSRGATRRFMC